MDGVVRYKDLVGFRGARLFSGAIDLDWYFSDSAKAENAAASYIFHGKAYHVGSGDQRLTDSVTFTEKILGYLSDGAASIGNTVLGIAGYGAGKSHYSLAVSYLFSKFRTQIGQTVFENIKSVDEEAAARIAEIIESDARPFLVIPVNGMRNQSLFQMFFDSVSRVLERDGVSRDCLLPFNPDVAYVRGVLPNIDSSKRRNILDAVGVDDDTFLTWLDDCDAEEFENLKDAMRKEGIQILRPQVDTSVKSLIPAVCNALCGPNGPYRGALIVFDEFGKYLSFASSREQVAGMGCIQHLYEGIQEASSSANIVMLGLSQLDLREYGVSLDDKASLNNFNRYETRFGLAPRYYLSVCFESIIANLIDTKSQGYIPRETDIRVALTTMQQRMHAWFPVMRSMSMWNSYQQFYDVTIRGCWPLSPLTVWVISYITSINSSLQQRTGLSLLGALFEKIADEEYENEDMSIGLPPVRLFDVGLCNELMVTEKMFPDRGREAFMYSDVMYQYGSQLSDAHKRILQAIVLSRKLSASCSDEEDAILLLQYLSGLKKGDATAVLQELAVDYNVIRYDVRSRSYALITDGMSLSQFSQLLDKKAAEYKHDNGIDELYRRIGTQLAKGEAFADIRASFFTPVQCSAFTEMHHISTGEWCYGAAIISGYDYEESLGDIVDVLSGWLFNDYDEPKGRMVYIIVPYNRSLDDVVSKVKAKISRPNELLPIMVQLLYDSDQVLLNAFSIFHAIQQLSSSNKNQYDALVSAKRTEILTIINDEIDRQRGERHIVTPIDVDGRLSKIGTELFERIYPEAISFTCDGFSAAKSTAVPSIMKFLNILATTSANWVMNFANQPVKEVNRADTLLNKGGWKVFDQSGELALIPGNGTLAKIFKECDSMLDDGSEMKLYGLVSTLMNPPYGLNSLGAVLATMVFLNARQEYIEIFDGGNRINASALIHKPYMPYNGKGFEKKAMARVRVTKMVSDIGKWQELVTTIEKSKTSEELIDAETKIDKYLNELHIQVPNTLIKRLNACENRIAACKEANAKFKEIIENESSHILNAPANPAQLQHVCKKFESILSARIKLFKEFSPDVVLESSYKRIYRAFVRFMNKNRAKWESGKTSVILTGSDIDFESILDTYSKLAEIYGLLGDEQTKRKMVAYAGRLKTRRSDYKQFIEEFIRVEANVMGVLSVMDLNGLPAEGTAVAFKNNLGNFRASLFDLSRHYADNTDAAPKIKNLQDAVLDGVGKCDDVLAKRKAELDDVFDMQVMNLTDVGDCRQKLSALRSFYGTGALPEVESYIVDLEKLESFAKEVGTLATQEEIDKRLSEILLSFEATRPQLADLVSVIGNQAKTTLNDKATQWVESLHMDVSHLNDVEKAKRLLYKINESPLYVSEIYSTELATIKLDIEMFISKEKVSYLLSLYDELSMDEKHEFEKAIGLR